MAKTLCGSVAAAFVLALALSGGASAATPNLGPNVIVFDPTMPTSQIQATVDAIASQRISNQFGTQRCGTRSRTRCRANSADWPPACGRSTSPAPRSQSHADGVGLGHLLEGPARRVTVKETLFSHSRKNRILAHCFKRRPVDNSAADENGSRSQRTRAAASTART